MGTGNHGQSPGKAQTSAMHLPLKPPLAVSTLTLPWECVNHSSPLWVVLWFVFVAHFPGSYSWRSASGWLSQHPNSTEISLCLLKEAFVLWAQKPLWQEEPSSTGTWSTVEVRRSGGGGTEEETEAQGEWITYWGCTGRNSRAGIPNQAWLPSPCCFHHTILLPAVCQAAGKYWGWIHEQTPIHRCSRLLSHLQLTDTQGPRLSWATYSTRCPFVLFCHPKSSPISPRMSKPWGSP